MPWHLPAGFNLTLADEAVVVEAGATLLMEGGTLDAELGALRLEGTASAPITIGSVKASPAAGDWGCLWLDGGDDVLRHVSVEYAGGGSGCTGAAYATAVFTDSPGSFEAVSFVSSAGSALLRGELLAACQGHAADWCDASSPFTYEDVEAPELECSNGPGVTSVALCE